jgi:hypothetical protein
MTPEEEYSEIWKKMHDGLYGYCSDYRTKTATRVAIEAIIKELLGLNASLFKHFGDIPTPEIQKVIVLLDSRITHYQTMLK